MPSKSPTHNVYQRHAEDKRRCVCHQGTQLEPSSERADDKCRLCVDNTVQYQAKATSTGCPQLQLHITNETQTSISHSVLIRYFAFTY